MLRLATWNHCKARLKSTLSAANTATKRLQDAADQARDVRPYEEIPKPSALPVLGTFLDYTKFRGFKLENFFEHLRKRHSELGPIYRENVLPGISEEMVFFHDQESTKTMLQNVDKYPFRQPNEFSIMHNEETGYSMGMSELNGEEWHRFRTVVNKYFLTNDSVWRYTNQHLEISTEFAKYLMKNLDENNRVKDLSQKLKMWSLESAAVFVLDKRLGLFSDNTDPRALDLIKSVGTVFEKMTELSVGPPWYKLYKTKPYKEFASNMSSAREHCRFYRMLAEEEHARKGTSSQLKIFLEKSNLPDGYSPVFRAL